MLASNSIFVKNQALYESGNKTGLQRFCSTCASLFIRGRRAAHSYMDDEKSVFLCTDFGLYATLRHGDKPYGSDRASQKRKHIVDVTLFTGIATTHTEDSLNRVSHLRSQIGLVRDMYGILTRTHRDYFMNDSRVINASNSEVILWIELTHPEEPCETREGTKITHPHAWVMVKEARDYQPHERIDYDPPLSLFPETFFDELVFICSSMERGTRILQDSPAGSLVYVKFYLNVKESGFDLKRCHIDVEPPPFRPQAPVRRQRDWPAPSHRLVR